MKPKIPLITLPEGIRVSYRDIQIMDALCAGTRTRKIAFCMNISPKTLKDYIHHAYRRNGMTRCEFFRAYAAGFNRRVLKIPAASPKTVRRSAGLPK